MGTPPIAQVVIDTAATAAFLLHFIAQTGHVAIIVVTPHQGDVFGNFQSVFHNIEHFFIRYEDLRYFGDITIDVL